MSRNKLTAAEKILARIEKKKARPDFTLHYVCDAGWEVSARRWDTYAKHRTAHLYSALLPAVEFIYVTLFDACPYHGVGLVQTESRRAGCPRRDCSFTTPLEDVRA